MFTPAPAPVADLPLREVETLEKTLGERRRTLVGDCGVGQMFASGVNDSRAEKGYRICLIAWHWNSTITHLHLGVSPHQDLLRQPAAWHLVLFFNIDGRYRGGVGVIL